MPDSSALLRTELTTLLRLTHTEAAIAQARRAQAASDETNRELAENAAKADERAALLTEQIQRLGGVPDVLGTALDRVSAFAKLQLDQTQSFSEALLGDLALERQLLDRTLLAKALAEASGDTEVVDVLDRLETAHTATVDWLHTRLAEVAVGGPAALRPTTVQAALSTAQTVAGLPVAQANRLVNRSIALAKLLRGRTAESAKATVERGSELASAGASVVAAGRDAVLDQTETVAQEQGADGLADSVHEEREDLGVLAAPELPIKAYENLNGDSIMHKFGEMDDPDEIRTVIAFEESHKNRKGVLKAAEARIEDIANELAGSGAT